MIELGQKISGISMAKNSDRGRDLEIKQRVPVRPLIVEKSSQDDSRNLGSEVTD